LGIQK